MPTHSLDVEGVRTIDFGEALAILQDHLHGEVRILISFHGTFGGASMDGRLTRLQTLPPEPGALAVFVDDRQSLMLDSVDTEASLIVGADDRRLLRFHLPSGVELTVEPAR